MKTRGLYRDVKPVTIGGKTAMLREHKQLNFYRHGTCNIPAQTADEAIEKLKACHAKREAKQI